MLLLDPHCAPGQARRVAIVCAQTCAMATMSRCAPDPLALARLTRSSRKWRRCCARGRRRRATQRPTCDATGIVLGRAAPGCSVCVCVYAGAECVLVRCLLCSLLTGGSAWRLAIIALATQRRASIPVPQLLSSAWPFDERVCWRCPFPEILARQTACERGSQVRRRAAVPRSGMIVSLASRERRAPRTASAHTLAVGSLPG